MASLLPSDMGRLIYGHLQSECSKHLADQFLDVSDSMKECRRQKHIGFNSKIHDRTLKQMLNEYSLLSDLIFEQSNEKECSHFNIVNTLQNLLQSRLRFLKIPEKVVNPHEETKQLSTTITSDRDPDMVTCTPHSLLNDVRIYDTSDKNGTNDSSNTISSPCKNFRSPLSSTLKPVCDSVMPSTPNIDIDTQPTQEISPTNAITSENISILPSTQIAVNEKTCQRKYMDVNNVTNNISVTPIQKQKSCEKLNMYRSSPFKGKHVERSNSTTALPSNIEDVLFKPVSATPITPTQNNIPSKQNGSDKLSVLSSSPFKQKNAENRNSTLTLINDTENVLLKPATAVCVPSPFKRRTAEKLNPTSTSPSNGENFRLKPVPAIPASSPFKQKHVERLNTAGNASMKSIPAITAPSVRNKPSQKQKLPDRTSEHPSKHVSKEVVNTTLILASDIETVLHKTPIKATSERCKEVKVTSTLNLDKISPATLTKQAIRNLPSSESKIRSVCTHLQPKKPVPWDFALRQSAMTDDVSNNNQDVVKSRKNRTPKKRKKNDVPNEDAKAENTLNDNKKKLEKKPVICKKQRKLEEAKKLAEIKKEKVAEKKLNASKAALALISSSGEKSKDIPEEVIDTLVMELSDGTDDEGPPIRREIDEEIVLFYKVSTTVCTETE